MNLIFISLGYVNKQNWRIWGSENPDVILEKPMHPLWATVLWGVWSAGIIGPYFIENVNEVSITFNSNFEDICDAIGEIWPHTLHKVNANSCGQPLLKWNTIPFLTTAIVFHNEKINFTNLQIVFVLFHFYI